MDSSSTEYYQVDKRDLGNLSGRTLLLGYETGTGLPQILRAGPPQGYGRGPGPSPPSQFISISPLEYNKAQHNRISDFVFPHFGKKNKATLWRADLGSAGTKAINAAYEHQRKDFTGSDTVKRLETLLCSPYVERLLDLTLTEFEIAHPEDRGNYGRLEPLLTTRYVVKEYRSLGPSRSRPSGDFPVPVTEEIVNNDAMGEKITAYFRARSSEASPLVLFLYDVFWAKKCFPKGSFPEAEEGINSLLYDPPKRYDLGAQSSGGSGWHQSSFQDKDADRSQDPRRPPPAGVQNRKARRDEGKVYLLDLKPAIESVLRYQDSKWDLYSAAQKFGIQVNEEEKNPVHDSLLIIRLWTLVFSGSPKKIREEELEDARKSAPATFQAKNESKGEDTNAAAPIRPDDEDVDPNDIPPGPSSVTPGASTFGKPQTAPEVDWENPFDEDEEDY